MDPFRSFPSFDSSFTAAAATYLYTSPKQGEVTPFSFLSFFTFLNHRSTYQNLRMLSNTRGVFWSPQKAGLPLGIRHS